MSYRNAENRLKPRRRQTEADRKAILAFFYGGLVFAWVGMVAGFFMGANL